VLDRAARFVKPSGRLAYITCSLLPQENGERIAAFTARHRGWRCVRPEDVGKPAGLAAFRSRDGAGLLLSPHRSGTDGFFLCLLARAEP
jgi:16S rRNA (cytosine967-C5)-methyltransferase